MELPHGFPIALPYRWLRDLDDAADQAEAYIGRVRPQHVTIDTLDSLYDELETTGGRGGQGLKPQSVLHIGRTLLNAFKERERLGLQRIRLRGVRRT